MLLGDFVENHPGERGQGYSDGLDVGKSIESNDVSKHFESNDVSKPEMSEVKIQHDELLKTISKFYMKDYDWGMITNDKNEMKKLKSIAPKLRIRKKKRN